MLFISYEQRKYIKIGDTDMDTKMEKYQKLWERFEILLKKENLNLSSFSKKWEKYHEGSENDSEKIYHRIKKQKNQLKALKRAPQQRTIDQIKDYIKFLDAEYIDQELLEDESYEHWFD